MRKKNQYGEPCTCGEEPIQPHPCPFEQDVNNNSETECECCAACETQCCLEI